MIISCRCCLIIETCLLFRKLLVRELTPKCFDVHKLKEMDFRPAYFEEGFLIFMFNTDDIEFLLYAYPFLSDLVLIYWKHNLR